jgi:hypothetical protein
MYFVARYLGFTNGCTNLEFLWDRAWERGVGWCRGNGEMSIKE